MFESFDITGLFGAGNDVIPSDGTCPLTSIKVCSPEGCARGYLLEEDGFRITDTEGVITFEVDTINAILPSTYLFEVTANDVVATFGFSLNIRGCVD